MGTRSTVRFFNEYSEKPILSVYQQYDGYIEGVGHELANWLLKKKVINGIYCLASQYVAEHKKKIGGFYLTTEDDTQDYNYEVRLVDEKFQIKVDDFFVGTPEELLNYTPKD